MSFFGVTGSMNLCSSHIYSNPKTIEAIKRQQEKARLARLEAEMPNEQKRAIEDANQRRREQMKKEEAWMGEFLRSIHILRSFALDNTREENSEIQPPKPMMNDIIRAFAKRNDTTYEAIVGDSRCKGIVRLRHQAMYEVRIARPDKTLVEIGRAFNRDHTSAMSGIGLYCLLNGIDHHLVAYARKKREGLAALSLKTIQLRIDELQKKAERLKAREAA